MIAETQVPASFPDLWSRDRDRQNAAYGEVLGLTEEPVTWAYAVWDDVVAHLSSRDNHDRSIAAQLLCNLSRSDPERRILRALPELLAVTHDERFVTARHALQSLWKIGTAGDAQRAALLDALRRRFADAAAEKNGTLVRYDLLAGLRRLYEEVGDDSIPPLATALIESEEDARYRRKYATLWRTRRGS